MLIVDQGMRRGFHLGAIAGMGAASAELFYATLAAAGASAASAAWQLSLAGLGAALHHRLIERTRFATGWQAT